MATGIDGAVLTIAIFMIFRRLLVFPTKLDIPVEEFRAEDLVFYSSSQIITKLHKNLVLITIAPNLYVNRHRHFYDQQTFSKWKITSHLVSNDQNNKQSILRIIMWKMWKIRKVKPEGNSMWILRCVVSRQMNYIINSPYRLRAGTVNRVSYPTFPTLISSKSRMLILIRKLMQPQLPM